MADDNLISIDFTSEEAKAIDDSLAVLENILLAKCKSLTPDQRREYGRLGNRTENWSKKVVDYMHTQPGFTPSFVDLAETDRDYNARVALKMRFNRLSALCSVVDDTMLMLGSDLYHSCVSYYRNVRLLAGQNVNGAKTIYDELSVQFPGRSNNTAPVDAAASGKA